MTKHAARGAAAPDRLPEAPAASAASAATAGEVLSAYLHTQAADFLRSLRLHGESGADVEEAAEAARLLRRAARRISGALAVYRPITDTAWSDQLRAELAWLSGTLALEHAYAGRLARLRDALHRLSGAGGPPDRTPPGDAAAAEPAPTSVDSEAVGASGSTTIAARAARGGVTAGIDGPAGAAPRSSRTARRSVSLATGAPDPSPRTGRGDEAPGGRPGRTPDAEGPRRPYEQWGDAPPAEHPSTPTGTAATGTGGTGLSPGTPAAPGQAGRAARSATAGARAAQGAGSAEGAGPAGGAGSVGNVAPAGGAELAGDAAAAGNAGSVGGAQSVGNAGLVGGAGLAGDAGSVGGAGSAGGAGSVGNAGLVGGAGSVGGAELGGGAGPAGGAELAGDAAPAGGAQSVGNAGLVGGAGPAGGAGLAGNLAPVGNAGSAGGAAPAGNAAAAGNVESAGGAGLAGGEAGAGSVGRGSGGVSRAGRAVRRGAVAGDGRSGAEGDRGTAARGRGRGGGAGEDRTAAHQRAADAEEARGGALTVGAARAGALLERQLTLAKTRAHTAALQTLGSSRFHAVADTVAFLASEVPLDEVNAGRPAEQVLPPLAELANRRLLEAVDALPLGRSGHPYNAEALVHGLAATPAADSPPASDRQDAPWHQVRRLVRMRRYALEVLGEMPGADAEPSTATRLLAAGQALERHRDAAEAAAAAAAAARTPRIAPATAYALGVLHADQRHEVEAARFAFGRIWRRVVGQAS